MLSNKILSVLTCLAVMILTSAATLVATAQSTAAQTACPSNSVRTNQIGRFSYSNAERNLGGAATCNGNAAIPADGIRVYSSWISCRNGAFQMARESAGTGIAPSSISCPNCSGQGAAFAQLAPGTSSSLTAFFDFPDGAEARYTATIARSAADANGRYVCSISNAQLVGSAFGGNLDAPTVTLGALNASANGTYTSAITLSDAAGSGTVFDASDLVLTNATATLSGSGTSFTATLTPQANGLITLEVPAAAFQDAFANDNTAATQVSATHVSPTAPTAPAISNTASDSTKPSVEIRGLPESFVGTPNLPVSIVFSEPVTGFTASDIALGNAKATAFAGSGATYTAVLFPSGRGSVTATIPAGVAKDASGNPNQKSATVTAINQSVEETQAQIATFMASRANNLASNQPDVSCFLAGGCKGRFNAQVTRNILSFDIASRFTAPVWFTLVGARGETSTTTGGYYLATFGGHQRLSDNALIGAMVQLDYQVSQTGSQSIKGRGWLIGPYFAGKFPDQPLFFEARALWGKSQNEITPFGTYTDTFETERMLLQGKVSGALEYPSITLRPSLAATYTTDRQKAYQDSLGNTIPAQQTALRQISAGLDFDKPILLGNQDWTLHGGISVIHSSTHAKGAIQVQNKGFEGTRGRVNLGLSHAFDGGQIAFSSFYDGIGSKAFKAVGLDVSLTLKF